MLYIIPKGYHRSFTLPKFTFSNKLVFSFKFNKSAIYNIEGLDRYDINKLYGMSDSWSHHKNNSVRIGWRWNQDVEKVELFLYVRNNKIIFERLITHINLGEAYIGKITIKKDSYNATVLSSTGISTATLDRYSRNSAYGLKYKLFPYFGGNKKALKTITIEINE